MHHCRRPTVAVAVNTPSPQNGTSIILYDVILICFILYAYGVRVAVIIICGKNRGGGGNRTIAARRIPLYCYYHTRNNIISYRVNTYLCILPALEARTSEKRSDIIIVHAIRVLHVL